jgi:hypothetical protein
VASLKKWADRFQIDPSNWWLLTVISKRYYDLSLKHMNLAVQDPQIDSSFPHTDIFVLIDKNGVVRMRRDKDGNPLLYHGLDSTSLANLSEDIVLLSLEKDRKKKSFFEGQLTTIAVSMLICFCACWIVFISLQKKICPTLNMLEATWKKNDRKATVLIVLFSLIIFSVVSVLGRVTLMSILGLIHIFRQGKRCHQFNSGCTIVMRSHSRENKALSFPQANNAYGDVSLHSLSRQLYLPSFVCR